MKRRFISLLTALVMVFGLAMPAHAAQTATVIRLAKTTGTVKVSRSSGKSLSLMRNMRLYNGYQVTTSKRSYAWLNLDSKKLAKEDAASKVEVRQNGRKLEVKVWSGSVFFNVTEKLSDDESLNISTSTMIVGIRGTSGYVQVVDRWTTLLTVLEGTVLCSVSDPVTGQIKTEEVHSGETVECVVYPQDQPGDKCDILRKKLTTDSIPGFVLKELVQDIPLCDKIKEASGLDIPRDLASVAGGDPSGRQPSGDTATPEVLGEAERLEDQDEDDLQKKLDEVDEAQKDQGNDVSGDKALPKQPSTGGNTSGGGTGGTTPTQPETPKSASMPLTDVEVQALLDAADSVTVQASDNPADNTLTIDTGLTVAAGKTLTLASGIDVTVDPSKNLAVDGTMNVQGGNLTNNGAVTVTSGDTLRVAGDVASSGTLTVTATGRIVAENGLSSSGSLRLTRGARVQAKQFGSFSLPSSWVLSAAADSSGYYNLIYTGMPLTDVEVQALLAASDNITIQASDDPAENTLTISTGLTVAAGKTLTLASGIDIKMEPSRNIFLDGTMTVNNIDDRSAMMVVNDGASLRVLGDFTGNAAILRVAATGSAVVDGKLRLDVTPRDLLQVQPGAVVKARTPSGTSWKVYWHWSDADTDGYRTFTYVPPPFSVTFDAASGTLPPTESSPGGGTASVQTDTDGKIPADNWPVPTRDGYVFEGWYTIKGLGNGQKREPGYAFVEDTTLYAHWSTPPVTYPVNFNANGGTFQLGDASDVGQTVVQTGEDGKIPTGDWPVPTWEGHTFQGWFTAASGGTKVESDNVFTTGDAKLYAQWSNWSYDEATKTLTLATVLDFNPTGDDAFWTANQALIEKVIILDGAGSIGDAAFSSCTSLTSVEIPDTVTSIGSAAFSQCTSLTSVEIPGSVTRIGDAAFSQCENLTSVILSKGIERIGGSAFSNCTGLTSIIFPDSISTIDNAAFSDCTGLVSVTIPNGVSTIGINAFYHCSSLESVTIPESVTSIGQSAFSYSGLTSVTVPGSVGTIAQETFRGCYGLTNVILSEGITVIGERTFTDCSALESVTIPASVHTLEQSAFYNCGITHITVPGSVGTIPLNAFQNCTNLKNVVLGDGITYINEYAFSGCFALTEITIPTSVTGASTHAFDDCQITVINFGGTTSQWNSGRFHDSGLLKNNPVVKCTNGDY